jgi:HPt (histidine-containing phosphotransfer) domain-containing protein
MSQDEVKEAYRRAHNLKGLAANIGAVRIAQGALELEQAIRNEKLDQIEGLLERLSGPLQNLLDSINRHLAAKPPLQATSTGKRIARHDLILQLGQLEKLLAEDDSLAIKYIEPISAALQGHPADEAFRIVVKAMLAYDFPVALAAVEPVRRLLQYKKTK